MKVKGQQGIPIVPVCDIECEWVCTGLAGNWTYTHTIRNPVIHRESPELKMQVTARKYEVRI